MVVLLNRNEKKNHYHDDILNKVNFTQIYNKHEEYVSVEDVSYNEVDNDVRIKKFKEVLDQRIIDYEKLKTLSWDGVPHSKLLL